MSQSFFPVEPVEVTPGTANAWTDVNVSSYAPSGATGVILHITCNSINIAFGIRKNGSTDNRTNTIYNISHFWAAIGVDGNRIFETYIGSTTQIDIYLVGYTKTGVTFFTNAYDKSLSTTSAWTDIDCSTECPNAIGLIFEQVSSGGNYNFGLRKNGSTTSNIGYNPYHSFAIVGCDGSQICEGFTANTDCDFYLIGYVTEGAVFNTNPTSISITTSGSYQDLTALPSNSVMGFIEVTGSNYNSYAFRKNGSSEDIYYDYALHPWAIVECDTNGVIEAKAEDKYTIYSYFVGYATGDTVTHYLSLLGVGA